MEPMPLAENCLKARLGARQEQAFARPGLDLDKTIRRQVAADVRTWQCRYQSKHDRIVVVTAEFPTVPATK
jgi:hypothetical protein